MTTYHITPVPKPRMTRSDKWKKRPCVMRYWAFKDECVLKGVEVPENGATVLFCIPMPKSWSKKKKAQMKGQAHKPTPDIDNLCKALLDAVYDDDSHIYHIELFKYWWDSGKILIEKKRVNHAANIRKMALNR